METQTQINQTQIRKEIERKIKEVRKKIIERYKEEWEVLLFQTWEYSSTSGVLHIRYRDNDYTMHIDNKLEYAPPEDAIVFFNSGNWYTIVSVPYDDDVYYEEVVIATGEYKEVREQLLEESVEYLLRSKQSTGEERKDYEWVVMTYITCIAALDVLNFVLKGPYHEGPDVE